MSEVDSADMCTEKLPLMLIGGRAEGLACAEPEARTHIGVCGNLKHFLINFRAISGDSKHFSF
jgi:hypothetical protein